MFGPKKKIKVLKKDLDQAVLARNKSLMRNVVNLEQEMAKKSDESKAIDLEKDKLSKECSAIKEDLLASKESLLSAKSNVGSARFELEDITLAVKSEEVKLAGLDKACEKVSKKNALLEKSVAMLQARKDAFNIKAKEVKDLDSEIVKSSKKLASVNSDIEKIQKEISNLDSIKKASKEQFNKDQDELAGKRRSVLGSISKINESLASANKKHEDSMRILDEEKKDKDSDIVVLDSLISKKELECSEISKKLLALNRDVDTAVKNIQTAKEEQVAVVAKVKSNFEKWKLNMLEEVAKLHLKGKINTIDKAGLSEILNG